MKVKIKNIFKFAVLLPILFGYSFSAYYEPNYNIKNYLEDLTENFTKITSYLKLGKEDQIPTSLFSSLADDFSVLKNKLPRSNPKFKVIYESCELITRSLSNGFTNSDLDAFDSQCFSPWRQISREIFGKYTINAKIKVSPISGNAPLTVTLDGRESRDPSADTIPKDNYYWYYKDSNGVQKLIGKGPLVKYTFSEPNTYVVHLTVRSANNASLGILDGEAKVNISVAPAIANVVLYVNGQRANVNSYVKISDDEGKRGVLLDASGTTPRGDTKIVESTWIVKRKNKIVYKDVIPDYPGAIRVKMLENGVYFVGLKIKDNTGKTVSKTFKVIVSNPVALINVKPSDKGNTSTEFIIDGSSSYSINGKLTKYKWSIYGPNGNIIQQFEGKKTFKKKFLVPGNYSIKLEVEDVNGSKNSEEYKFYVDSTPPVANFIYNKFDNWEKPSTFVFDASYSYDVDVPNGDELSYIWNFSNRKNVKVQYIKNGKKIIAVFNKKGLYKVTLIVKDKYGKENSITKNLEVKSTLRPELSVNPNYTVLGNPISIKVKSNKVVSYYEYYFGDKKNIKTQQNFIEHTYKTAGVFTLQVKASSIDGDTNTITKKVFIGQRGYPIAVYNVFKGKNQQLTSTNCIVNKNGKKKLVSAYEIDRQENFIIDGKNSVNGQGEHSLLKIYFQKDNEKEYINNSIINTKFYELGCRKITLFVRDLNTNKLDKKDIYFKVKNAKPILKDLKMYFPQYGGNQAGSFQPKIGNNNVPKDIFTTGFDPLLVKIVARGAQDKDSSILSYFRWYYYKKGDRENPVKVKITPYNIPEAIFAVPRIPGEYIFGVDVCDVDGGCTNSEDYLHLMPVVNIPKSAENPNYPQINSVRVDADGVKGVSEVNIGEKVSIVVNSSLPSKKSDFKSTRTFKYDFDNDGKWDLTTKKSKVEYIFKKPYKKHRVKVMVLYRGNASNYGYSSYFVVKKGVKALIDINHNGQDLIFNDMSLGDIKTKSLCFDVKKCKKDKNYLITKDEYGHIYYDSSGKKLLYFKVKDNYGNISKKREVLEISENNSGAKLLTLPKQNKKGKDYVVNVGGSYTDSFVIYYKSETIDDENCYIDKNIIIDSDGDGNAKNDKDLLCNRTYKLTYPKTPKVILAINDNGVEKKVNVEFLNIQVSIPKEYQELYNDILSIIEKYSSDEDEDIKGLRTYLVSLLDNIDDRIERDSILVSIKDWLDTNPGILEESDETKLNNIYNKLSDKSVRATSNNTSLDNLKTDLEIYLDGVNGSEEILSFIDQLEGTTNKQKRKELLEKIYKKVGTLKDSNAISLDQFEDIKKDICNVLSDYKIESKACGAKTDVKVNTKESTFKKILKIIGWFALAIIIIFIIIMIVFVIKAKQKREEDEEE